MTAVIVTDADKDYVDLTISTPEGEKIVRSTAHHPFCNASTREWVDAGLLHAGEELSTPGNGRALLASTGRFAAKIRTYNLTVDDLHTYYVVAGRTPVLVHNCGGKVPWITGKLPAAEESALNHTLANIDAGTVPSGPTAKKWGTPFKNWGGDLPGDKGPSSPYLEYRVAPPAGVSGPGALRVVRDQNSGATYYTWTHYGDSGSPAFVRIR